MPEFPEELDFLSLFECEASMLDNRKDYPFYYNQATYRFSNGDDDFIIELSPSSGEVKIQVIKSDLNRLISLVDLKRVQKLEITADTKEHASILLMIINEDSQQTVKIDFKPYFKQIFKEHLSR